MPPAVRFFSLFLSPDDDHDPSLSVRIRIFLSDDNAEIVNNEINQHLAVEFDLIQQDFRAV